MDTATNVSGYHITTRGMLRVMENRGWTPSAGSFNASGVYTLGFSHATACGMDRAKGSLETPRLPLTIDDLWVERVLGWANAVAVRHGVSVKNILTETAAHS